MSNVVQPVNAEIWTAFGNIIIYVAQSTDVIWTKCQTPNKRRTRIVKNSKNYSENAENIEGNHMRLSGT